MMATDNPLRKQLRALAQLQPPGTRVIPAKTYGTMKASGATVDRRAYHKELRQKAKKRKGRK